MRGLGGTLESDVARDPLQGCARIQLPEWLKACFRASMTIFVRKCPEVSILEKIQSS
jgi:hypothetical protein